MEDRTIGIIAMSSLGTLIVFVFIYIAYLAFFVFPKHEAFYKTKEFVEMVDNYVETLPTMTDEGRTFYREHHEEIFFLMVSFVIHNVMPKTKGLPPSEKFMTSFKKALSEFRIHHITFSPIVIEGDIRVPLKFFNDYGGIISMDFESVKVNFEMLNKVKLDKVKVLVISGENQTDLPPLYCFSSLEALYIVDNKISNFLFRDYVTSDGNLKTMPNVQEILLIHPQVSFRSIYVNMERFTKIFPMSRAINVCSYTKLLDHIEQLTPPMV